ncbi:hypothetical protein [Leptolyngbya sp. ST-U4]|uniref:hypothetical protein n=2 Tax=unclassified Leptolyngbya TaxID=2650499 RepID=UPI0019A2EF9F|nr:hypothetical protein [Cyanobacteria bacterium FACHB-502]
MYILLITLIFILSVRSFAAFLNPALNSDNAIHILMAYDLRLPQDFYYWGQDRLGSLVPIIGHFLLKITSVSPVIAVSLAQYLLLLIGFLAFASLLKSNLLKVILALAWFLPLVPFTELVMNSQPYGPQMAFIGIAIVLASRFENSPSIQGFKRQLFIALITISLFISIWLSDFSLVTALLFGGIVVGSIYQRGKKNVALQGLKRFGLTAGDAINVALTSAIGIAFIAYAKENAANTPSRYSTFNSFSEVQEIVAKLLSSVLRTITFKNTFFLTAPRRVLFLGIHAILVVVLIATIAYLIHRLRKHKSLTVSKWCYLFLLNAIASLILLPLSKWVYINGANLRYFTVSYISLWLAVLFFADGLKGANSKLMSLLLVLVALASSLSLPPRTYALNAPQPKIQELQEFQALGKAGFIGGYWSSYILCTVNPAQLNCTPFDEATNQSPCLPNPEQQKKVGRVRCRRCTKRVFESETIYLVKEKWLDEFPEEIQQFRHCLVKAGDAKKVGDYTIAPYRDRTKGLATEPAISGTRN